MEEASYFCVTFFKNFQITNLHFQITPKFFGIIWHLFNFIVFPWCLKNAGCLFQFSRYVRLSAKFFCFNEDLVFC